MNAVKHLLEEHKQVKDLFKQYEEAGERAHKKKLEISQEVFKKLFTHEQIEERIFYPAAMKKVSKETQDLIREGYEEHHVADYLVEQIKKTEPGDETYDAKFTVLMESVQHHIKEEEKTLFPETRKVMGNDLERIGQEMEQLEQQLQGQAEAHAKSGSSKTGTMEAPTKMTEPEMAPKASASRRSKPTRTEPGM